MQSLVIVLLLMATVYAQRLVIYNASNMLNIYGEAVAMDQTMDVWNITAIGSMVFAPHNRTSYLYTLLQCRDYSLYNGLEIVMSAPPGADFTVSLQSSSAGCGTAGSSFSQRSSKFITFGGTLQTLRIPFEWLTLFDPRHVQTLILSGFTIPSQQYTIHEIAFAVGDGVRHTCPSFQEAAMVEDFHSLDGWADDSQVAGGPDNYEIVGNAVRFAVSPEFVARPKLRLKDHTFKGTDYDDYHEVDFEIGYGAAKVRQQLGAQDNHLVAYMTSQATDGASWISGDGSQVLVTGNAWHDLTLDVDLDITGTQFIIRWWIDGVLVKSSGQAWGPQDIGTGFTSHISLESMWWMAIGLDLQKGDRADNVAYFDTYKFTPTSGCVDPQQAPVPVGGDQNNAVSAPATFQPPPAGVLNGTVPMVSHGLRRLRFLTGVNFTVPDTTEFGLPAQFQAGQIQYIYQSVAGSLLSVRSAYQLLLQGFLIY
ncbi:hypothetical protein RI367_000006 [Sorochytrium milnesiophthora]